MVNWGRAVLLFAVAALASFVVLAGGPTSEERFAPTLGAPLFPEMETTVYPTDPAENIPEAVLVEWMIVEIAVPAEESEVSSSLTDTALPSIAEGTGTMLYIEIRVTPIAHITPPDDGQEGERQAQDEVQGPGT